ncbi:PD-(D/E)XK nuclease family protein, partial [Nitratireductor sp. ZSWI3]|uniref:PD-(D/E)XK nuclease family protein n=1 Tax=Nitratireductor sp. ZSWI3 TaxID=2966359 RepID=UPI00214F7534
EPPPVQADLPRPLTPSRAGALIEAGYEPVPSSRSPVLDDPDRPGFAVQRGLAMHRLLQMLPECPASGREAAARRYLARAGSAWSEAEREAAWRSVSAILDDARFQPLFAAGSRAEVSVLGEVSLNGVRRAVSGTMDRLAVTADTVLIVDYKTSRPVPQTLDQVPPAYVAQMALYAELLKPLYPGRAVQAALLFTEAPLLLPVSAERLSKALAGLGGT